MLHLYIIIVWNWYIQKRNQQQLSRLCIPTYSLSLRVTFILISQKSYKRQHCLNNHIMFKMGSQKNVRVAVEIRIIRNFIEQENRPETDLFNWITYNCKNIPVNNSVGELLLWLLYKENAIVNTAHFYLTSKYLQHCSSLSPNFSWQDLSKRDLNKEKIKGPWVGAG